ncbi:hypothetical protein J1614_005213 [Plenodomus biglobosus]|nr:hypothetical protein J1614_005213 [Plenodomus biglobosus]
MQRRTLEEDWPVANFCAERGPDRQQGTTITTITLECDGFDCTAQGELGINSVEQAIGVIPGKEGGVTLLVKKADRHHQPATSVQTVTFGPQRSTRNALTQSRTYAAIVNSTTKRNYRPDLRKDAVARASAIRKSQKPVKADTKQTKLRGAKATKAAAQKEEA